MSAVDCLEDVVKTEPARIVFACLESALHRGSIHRREAVALTAKASIGARRVLAHAGRASESGTESLMSFDLRQAGILFRQQVEIGSVGRVDFVVGRTLVIEVDGAQFHSSVEAFERDRVRDAELSIRGYRVLRFSYRQLTVTPGLVMRAVVASIARGDSS
jgi:very-short-patch-repair endonuclease